MASEASGASGANWASGTRRLPTPIPDTLSMYVCIYIYLYICIHYIYIYMCIHIYIYIYTCVFPNGLVHAAQCILFCGEASCTRSSSYQLFFLTRLWAAGTVSVVLVLVGGSLADGVLPDGTKKHDLGGMWRAAHGLLWV